MDPILLTLEVLAPLILPRASLYDPAYQLIGLDAVQQQALGDGSGESVAILDTAFNLPGHRPGRPWLGDHVSYVWDFAENDGDVSEQPIIPGTLPAPHGNDILSIVHQVAPNAGLILLKVAVHSVTTWDAIEGALQWCIAHAESVRLASVNMSLSYGAFSTETVPPTPIDDELTTLRGMGVYPVASAGNYYKSLGLGLGYPAVGPAVVSVGAVWSSTTTEPHAWADGSHETGTVADKQGSFSQRSAQLSFLAPGDALELNSTSHAAPVVAAAFALLWQACDAAGIDDSEAPYVFFKAASVRVPDVSTGLDDVPHDGFVYDRIDLLAALSAVTP